MDMEDLINDDDRSQVLPSLETQATQVEEYEEDSDEQIFTTTKSSTRRTVNASRPSYSNVSNVYESQPVLGEGMDIKVDDSADDTDSESRANERPIVSHNVSGPPKSEPISLNPGADHEDGYDTDDSTKTEIVGDSERYSEDEKTQLVIQHTAVQSGVPLEPVEKANAQSGEPSEPVEKANAQSGEPSEPVEKANAQSGEPSEPVDERAVQNDETTESADGGHTELGQEIRRVNVTQPDSNAVACKQIVSLNTPCTPTTSTSDTLPKTSEEKPRKDMPTNVAKQESGVLPTPPPQSKTYSSRSTGSWQENQNDSQGINTPASSQENGNSTSSGLESRDPPPVQQMINKSPHLVTTENPESITKQTEALGLGDKLGGDQVAKSTNTNEYAKHQSESPHPEELLEDFNFRQGPRIIHGSASKGVQGSAKKRRFARTESRPVVRKSSEFDFDEDEEVGAEDDNIGSTTMKRIQSLGNGIALPDVRLSLSKESSRAPTTTHSKSEASEGSIPNQSKSETSEGSIQKQKSEASKESTQNYSKSEASEESIQSHSKSQTSEGSIQSQTQPQVVCDSRVEAGSVKPEVMEPEPIHVLDDDDEEEGNANDSLEGWTRTKKKKTKPRGSVPRSKTTRELEKERNQSKKGNASGKRTEATKQKPAEKEQPEASSGNKKARKKSKRKLESWCLIKNRSRRGQGFVDPSELADRCFSELHKNHGWSWDHGMMNATWLYLKPGVTKKTGTLGVDMFNGSQALVDYLRASQSGLLQKMEHELRRNTSKRVASSPPDSQQAQVSAPSNSKGSSKKRERSSKRHPTLDENLSSQSQPVRSSKRARSSKERSGGEKPRSKVASPSSEPPKRGSLKRRSGREAHSADQPIHRSSTRKRGSATQGGSLQFNDCWEFLKKEKGWTFRTGSGLVDWYYCPPAPVQFRGKVRKEFAGEDQVLEFLQEHPGTLGDLQSPHAAPSPAADSPFTRSSDGPHAFTPKTLNNCTFLFTGFTNENSLQEELSQVVVQHGGKVWDSGDLPKLPMAERLVVVARPSSSRHIKFSFALACGIPAIHFAWLQHSAASGRVQSWEAYELPTGFIEKPYLGTMSLLKGGQRRSKQLLPPAQRKLNLFQGKELVLANFDGTAQAGWAGVLEAAGAKVVKSSRLGSGHVVSVVVQPGPKSDARAEKVFDRARTNKVPIVSLDWVLSILQRQRYCSTDMWTKTSFSHYLERHPDEELGNFITFSGDDKKLHWVNPPSSEDGKLGTCFDGLKFGTQRYDVGDVVVLHPAVPPGEAKSVSETDFRKLRFGRVDSFWQRPNGRWDVMCNQLLLRHDPSVEGKEHLVDLEETIGCSVAKIVGKVACLLPRDAKGKAYCDPKLAWEHRIFVIQDGESEDAQLV